MSLGPTSGARGPWVLSFSIAVGLVSIWLPSPTMAQDVLVDFGATWKFFRGRAAPSVPLSEWRVLGFDDSTWESGPMGIGYGDGDDATLLSDMRGNYVSVYARRVFTVAAPASVGPLTLGVDFDDGYLCYINGVEVARDHMGAAGREPDQDTTASRNHEAGKREFVPLAVPAGTLVAGDNILCVEGHNVSLTSSDFSLDVRLAANDESFNCPTNLACARSLATGSVRITWDSVIDYDSIAVARDGTPLPGSPFAGEATEAIDSDPGTFAHTYEVRARFGGFECAALSCSLSSEFVLIDDDETWSFFRGTEAPSAPPDAWRQPGFDDSTWERGATGIGYGDGDDATVLDDMRNGYLSVFCRRAFDVGVVPPVENLLLEVDYDDGFVAYLNGTEVARSANLGAAGADVPFDRGAAGGHEADGAVSFDLTDRADLLVAGRNGLAVQVHNVALGSSDLSFIPRLLLNTCPRISGLRCAWDATSGSVRVDWDASPVADGFVITRNGEPLPGSPLPAGATSITDSSAGSLDARYEVAALVGGQSCRVSSCTVTCGARDPESLQCVLSLAGGTTRAELTWSTPAGTTSIDVSREGTHLATLDSTAGGFTDPDVESLEPEDDTDYRVVFHLATGETCTRTCHLSLCPRDFTCQPVDVGGVYRFQITWSNVVKEWNVIDIERDGEVIDTIAGDERSYLDGSLEAVAGESHTYRMIPVAPVGEEVGTICERTCTVRGPLLELAGWEPPEGGWDYFTDFSGGGALAYEAAAGVAGNIDGNWTRSTDNDSWDGSAPGEVGPAPGGPAPGGVERIARGSEGTCGAETEVLRIVDPGNPSNPGTSSLAGAFPAPYDEPNNREILLGLDTGVTDRNLLRDGVTFVARWRLDPAPPEYMNAGTYGDGSPLDNGHGQVGFYFRDAAGDAGLGDSAGLAFNLQSGDRMLMSTTPTTTVRAMQDLTFRAIWVTVEDPEGDGTYDVALYLNGAEVPFDAFTLAGASLAGGSPDFGSALGNTLAFGAVGGGSDSAIEIDFIGYKEGVHAPVAVECTPSDNRRPTARIDASPSTSVMLAGGSARVTLDGSSSDDGDGGSQGLAYLWTKVSGPAGDEIVTPTRPATEVTFGQAGLYRYQLRVDDGEPVRGVATARVDITVRSEGGVVLFKRGDLDADGKMQITDAIGVFNFLFLGGVDPRCFDGADADDSGTITITDGVRILNVLFLGSGVIPPPGYTDCGPDPTNDSLGACAYDACP